MFTGVLDGKFLLVSGSSSHITARTRLGDGNTFCQFELRKVEILNRWGNITVENAVNIRFPAVGNLGVSIAGQVFEQIDIIVCCSERNILNIYCAFFLFVKLIFFYGNLRLFRIIDRSTGNFIRIGFRSGGSHNGIWKLIRLNLQQISVENNYLVRGCCADIVIICSDIVDCYRTEDCNRCEALVDHRCSGNFCIRSLFDPLFKHLTGYKGILRHGFNGFTVCPEELREGFNNGCAIITEYYETYVIFILKFGSQLKVRGDSLSTIIFCFTNIPTQELLTFNNRRSGQSQLISCIICIGLESIAFNLVGDGKYIFGIFCPNLGICSDGDIVIEDAASVYPFTDIAGFSRNSRNVVQAITGINIDCLTGKSFCIILIFIERDSIGDLGIVRNHDHIVICRFGVSIDSISGHMDFRALFALPDFTYCPGCIITITGNYSWQPITDRFALSDINSLIDFGITIIECNSPDQFVITGLEYRVCTECFWQ